MSALLEDFADGYAQRGIRLDGFQVEACRALLAGRDVLVAAPTGSGKTVVAHFAVELARPGPTRSTRGWPDATGRRRSACSPATPRSTATPPSSS